MGGVVVAPEAELLVLLEPLAQRHAGRDRGRLLLLGAAGRDRPRVEPEHLVVRARIEDARSLPSSISSPQPPTSTKPLLCSSTEFAPERARRKLPPSHSIMQRTPSRVSWSQVSELWKVPLRSRKLTKAVTEVRPSSRKHPDRSRREPRASSSRPRGAAPASACTWMLVTFCLGWALQMGRVVDPAEAGLPVGGEDGRAGLGDRAGSASAASASNQSRRRQDARKQGISHGDSPSAGHSLGGMIVKVAGMNLNRS